MREAISQIADPIQSMFFKAHLTGMERLVEITRQWYDAPTPELQSRIEILRKNLMTGLEALKRNPDEPASAHIAN